MNNNSYASNMTNILNQYLSNIAVLNINLYNYHWNVIGPLFNDLHSKLQEYYEQTTLMFDQIAERIKMLNGFPITSLQNYSQISTIKNIESKNYNDKDIIIAIIKDFEIILTMTYEIGTIANQANDLNTINLMTNYATFFDKQLWILRANLKQKEAY